MKSVKYKTAFFYKSNKIILIRNYPEDTNINTIEGDFYMFYPSFGIGSVIKFNIVKQIYYG